MGTVVTVMNMKGGVGKTTVCAHLAGLFARYKIQGKSNSVLVIDYDAQFNLSQLFLRGKRYPPVEQARKTSLRILLDNEVDLDPFKLQLPSTSNPPAVAEIVHPIYRRLDLIASTLDLMYIALGMSDGRLDIFESRFAAFIEECRDVYDVVLIDCHPAGSILTKTALQNSDHVLIPVVPEAFAVRGVVLMRTFIDKVRGNGTRPGSHILFNKAPRTGVRREETRIRGSAVYGPMCLTQTLKNYGVFRDPSEGQSFVWLSKKAWSTQAFYNLLVVGRELSARILTTQETP